MKNDQMEWTKRFITNMNGSYGGVFSDSRSWWRRFQEERLEILLFDIARALIIAIGITILFRYSP